MHPSPSDFNERELNRAIQILTRQHGVQKETTPTMNVGSKREELLALTIVLQVVNLLDGTIGGARLSYRGIQAKITTICTARVICCLKRFVDAGRHQLGRENEHHCCKQQCQRRLMRLILLMILFQLCRVPQTARALVTEKLDEFLVESNVELFDEMAQRTANANTDALASDDLTIQRPRGETTTKQADDSRDLMVAVDPFDWCFQALSVQLSESSDFGEVFLIPIGPHTVCTLVDGDTLPADELEDHARRLERARKTLAPGASRERSPQLKRHPRKLPSMFSFSSSDDGSAPLPRICFNEIQRSIGRDGPTVAAWQVALSSASSAHFALRSLVGLGLHLPDRSPERRQFLTKTGERIRQVLALYSRQPLVLHNTCANGTLRKHRGRKAIDLQLPPHQAKPVHGATLQRLAAECRTVFDGAASSERVDRNIKDRTEPGKHHQSIAQAGTPETNKTPIVASVPPKSKITSTRKGLSRLPVALDQRLSRVSNDIQQELSRWTDQRISAETAEHAKIRARRRQEVCEQIARLEDLRKSLDCGLGILRADRQHPDPNQPFLEWARALPTIESHERDRQTEMQTRQRLILEQQYQRDARHRREREERTQMSTNDSNISENSNAHASKAHFLEIQHELRRLEDENVDMSQVESGNNQELQQQHARQQRERAEHKRRQQVKIQKQEAHELSQMRREDHYVAEQALRAQQQARQQRDRDVQDHHAACNRAVELQQRKIDELRARDRERKLIEQELASMRVEELHARQFRFFLAEKDKVERQVEQTARKQLQAEEQDSRWRWKLLQRIADEEQAAETKRQRAEARRIKRQQQRTGGGQAHVSSPATWVQCWDASGNVYYYNSETGISQWELPPDNKACMRP